MPLTDEQGNVHEVYRYRIKLNDRRTSGEEIAYSQAADLVMDIAIDDVNAIRNRLILWILAVAVFTLIVVLVIANTQANSITRPVRILLHDIDQVARGNLDHQTRPHSKDEIGLSPAPSAT